MPNVSDYSTEEEWMGACVPVRESEGDDHDQAVAVCLNMWRNKGKSIMGNHLKSVSKTDEEIRVANYMVLFGGRDLTDEFFTKNTEFESQYTKSGVLYVDWEHGLDYDDDAPQRDDILGVVDWKTAKKDDKGLWVERVLSRRNEYMQFLETLIDEGLVGTSSEAVGGKVHKTDEGEITRWPLKRDALTVTPAEPRMMTENAIAAIKHLSEFKPELKTLLQDQVMVGDVGDGEDKDIGRKKVESNKGGQKMSDNITMSSEQFAELKAMLATPKEPEKPEVNPLEAQFKALHDEVEGYRELIQNSPILKDAGYVAPDSEEDHPEVKTWGDFIVAVRLGNRKRLESVYKTALAEDAGAQGGFLVPEDFGTLLLDMAKDYNALRRAGAMVTTIVGRSKVYPVLDVETAPSAGDSPYAGGVAANWTEEAASITESEPRFRQIELILHKLAAYALASNEVREDAAEAIDGIVARAFAKAVGSSEEYAFFRGNGVGKPLGILSSGALISATRSAASTVALADLSQMISDLTPDSWGKAAWFISPAVVDQLIQLVSNPLSWAPNMRDDWRQPQLFGYPVYPVGCLPALNTAGDILLVDPDYYLIGEKPGGLSIAYSEHFRFQNDQGAWRVVHRVDGQPMVDNAITAEDGSTTYSPFVALAAG